jgi:SulP family sulfate permease
MTFTPKLLLTSKNYTRHQFYKDLMAGIIVGIVALPLAIAFGIASGVSPEKGLTTAIIAGFVISLFGGSKVQIGGPTGAFIVIVYGIIQQYGVTGLAIATLLAGIMLIVMGVLKLGSVIKFIPFPVVVGFTSGIALTIFTTQVKDATGMEIQHMPASFIDKWIAYGSGLGSINVWSVGVCIVTVLIIISFSKITKKIPGTLIAIVAVTAGAWLLRFWGYNTGIETIGDRFIIQANMPHPVGLHIDFSTIQMLLPAAFTIAMLGAIESLLSAMVADGMIGDKHDSNTELIAQGIANVVVPLFGGIPATGAIARTMTNINNGGRTPVAGLVHAVVLLLILLFLSPLAKHIPMACLAGVLIVVSYNMCEWRTFRSLLKNAKSDVAVLLVTFTLTVVFDLTIAIVAGLLLAMLLLIKRLTETSNITVFKEDMQQSSYNDTAGENETLAIPEGVEVYEINGPFFFGIANKFDEIVTQVAVKPQARILRMRKVPFIDSTGLHNLESFIRLSKHHKIKIILSGVNDTVHQALRRSGIAAELGDENICSNINDALKVASINK